MQVSWARVDRGRHDQLRERWAELAPRADVTFFTSWGWLGPWLATLPPDVEVEELAVTDHGRTVGLALLASSEIRRHRVLRSRVTALHASGQPDLDLIAVEYNGFVVDRDLGPTVRRVMGEAVMARSGTWDELVLPGCAHPLPVDPARLGHHLVRRIELDAPFVPLDKARAAGGVLQLISANRRSRIRRAMRDYRELGPLSVETAGSLGRAREFLAALARDHQASWTERGQPGAFAGRGFAEFHDAVLAENFDRGGVQLCRVTAGDVVVGHAYNLVHDGRVMNYQTGFDYGLLDGKGSPGFVSHALIVAHNAELGHHAYDFLAGNEPYKRSLGTESNPMTWLVIRRRTPTFLAEQAARRLRDRVRDERARRRGPAPGGSPPP